MTAEERAELERAIAWLEDLEKRGREIAEAGPPTTYLPKAHLIDRANLARAALTAARERLAMDRAKGYVEADGVLHVYRDAEEFRAGITDFNDNMSEGHYADINGFRYHPATERGEGEG